MGAEILQFFLFNFSASMTDGIGRTWHGEQLDPSVGATVRKWYRLIGPFYYSVLID